MPVADGRFRLAVDRSFTLPGAGTVVTGTVLSGYACARPDRHCQPVRPVRRACARSTRRTVRAERGEAGQRCALNLAGATGSPRRRSRAATWCSIPNFTRPPTASTRSCAFSPPNTRPVTQWMPVRLHHAAADVAARVVLLGDEPIKPGTTGARAARSREPDRRRRDGRLRAARHHRPAHDRRQGASSTCARPARKRRTPGAPRAARTPAQRPTSDKALTALLDRAPWFADLSAFARDRALADAAVDAWIADGAVIRIAGTTLGLRARDVRTG